MTHAPRPAVGPILAYRFQPNRLVDSNEFLLVDGPWQVLRIGMRLGPAHWADSVAHSMTHAQRPAVGPILAYRFQPNRLVDLNEFLLVDGPWQVLRIGMRLGPAHWADSVAHSMTHAPRPAVGPILAYRFQPNRLVDLNEFLLVDGPWQVLRIGMRLGPAHWADSVAHSMTHAPRPAVGPILAYRFQPNRLVDSN